MTNQLPGRNPELDDAVRGRVDAGMPRAVADLSALVRIPSVSWAAFDRDEVARSARAVADLCEGLGVFDSVSVVQAPVPGGEEAGQPAVLATRAARDGRPTVLLYAHHDVQPPGSDADWDTPVFEPTVRGDRLYGRGAADDKAGVAAHVAALRAVASAVAELQLGLAVFIEGEEESGSRSFATFLEQNKEALAADVIVVADSDNWSIEVPALTVALRGMVAFTLTVRTLGHASHSGMFGGAVPDGMMAMTRLLASLHNPDGSVAVAGMASHAAAVPEHAEAATREAAAVLDGVQLIGGGPVLSRIWYQPSITVTGLDVPSIANASNTLLPAVSARISARIAPGQTAREACDALESHLRRHAPFGARIQIEDVNLGEAFLVDAEGWAAREATRAMADAWGAEPVRSGVGGSIPFVADLVRAFPHAQILVTGVEDPDTRAHSPNESLHLGVFKRAILTEALLLARLNAHAAPVG